MSWERYPFKVRSSRGRKSLEFASTRRRHHHNKRKAIAAVVGKHTPRWMTQLDLSTPWVLRLLAVIFIVLLSLLVL